MLCYIMVVDILITQIIQNLQPAIGQKLTGIIFNKENNSLRLFFEDDAIVIDFPQIDCRCIECLDKADYVKERDKE